MARVIRREVNSNHDVYTIEVDGTEISVTVTATASVVKNWLSATLYFRRRHVYLEQLVVGLGVQWTPGGGSDPPPADTLQLCVGQRCLIFRLSHAGRVPSKLRRFLRDPSHTFVGFWNNSDHRKLKYSKHGLEMARDPLDLRLHVEVDGGENLAEASVDQIIETCLGFEVEQKREISVSDWDKNYLSYDQVAYAAVDAYCAFLIGRNSRAWELNKQVTHSKCLIV